MLARGPGADVVSVTCLGPRSEPCMLCVRDRREARAAAAVPSRVPRLSRRGRYARSEWTEARFPATSSRCRAARVTADGPRTRSSAHDARCARAPAARRQHAPAAQVRPCAPRAAACSPSCEAELADGPRPADPGRRRRRHRRGRGRRRRRRQRRRRAVGAGRGLPARPAGRGRISPEPRGDPVMLDRDRRVRGHRGRRGQRERRPGAVGLRGRRLHLDPRRAAGPASLTGPAAASWPGWRTARPAGSPSARRSPRGGGRRSGRPRPTRGHLDRDGRHRPASAARAGPSRPRSRRARPGT